MLSMTAAMGEADFYSLLRSATESVYKILTATYSISTLTSCLTRGATIVYLIITICSEFYSLTSCEGATYHGNYARINQWCISTHSSARLTKD